MKRAGILLVATVLLTGCTAPAPEAPTRPAALGGTVTVFAAASLTAAFDALAAEFEQQHPEVDVVVNYGGSSGLATQITEGAPADVFAAANESTMARVVDAGDAGDTTVFTTNTLVLVTPAGNPAGVTGLADLANPDFAIALCDPAVPCGSAAQALLDTAGVTAAPDTLEEDVKAVLTKVQLGEADAGLVYVTDAHAPGVIVDIVYVPEAQEVVNRYPIAVLTGAPNPDAAQAWVDFVLSDAGQQALADAGFLAP
ncbi:MAG: molybdate ABC transporter substrate-binding protein [Pseudolysinimonas sp.]